MEFGKLTTSNTRAQGFGTIDLGRSKKMLINYVKYINYA